MTSLGPQPPRPPRWAERLLASLLPWQYRDESIGDLREGFLRRAGSPRAARAWYRRQVLRSLPSAIRLRHQTRHDPNTLDGSMETLGQDIRYALRSLVKSPGFAIVSTVTLALAIGVNTSIFSLVNVIVFADLPMQETESIAVIRGVNAELGMDQESVSPADYFDLVERSRSYESLSALTEGTWVLTGGDQPLRLTGLQVTAGLFDTWRLPPVLGRAFAEGEDRYGADRVAMLSHGFWQDQYAGRRDVLGEALTLDGLEYTIVGVADPQLEFASFSTAQVILPLIMNRGEPNRAIRYLFVVGRLAPDVTQEMATEDARRIGAQLADEYPEQNRGWALWSAPAMESLLDAEANRILLLLQLTVGMVILIACANVANMLLARSSVRAREFAVRSALGAGRGRLMRQLLTESLVISFAAAALGLGVAVLLNRGLVWVSAGTEVIFQMAEIDGRVLGFTLMVSLAAPVVFGLFPALRASQSGPSGALRDGRGADGGRTGKRARGALVVAQISLALTLMVVATLMTRTVVNMSSRPLGFDATDVLTIRIDLPDDGAYEVPEATVQFFAEAGEALAALPGFGAVELTSTVPGAGFGARRSLEIEGVELPEGRAAPTASFNMISPGFFEELGLSLQGGRGFVETDNAESFPVAIVSREVADDFWTNEDPVGRRLRVAGTEEWIQVVGVVSDMRSADPESPAASIYVPHAQDARKGMYLLSRTTTDPSLAAGAIRDAIWGIDGQLPVGAIRTLEQAYHRDAATSYALAALFVTFAFFALIMAGVGIYGVMAYSVAQREGEIGLRMALGAEVGAVRWMVVWQGTRLLIVGLAFGMGAAFLVSQLLDSLVYGISATDPVTFVGVPAILAVVALVANLIPALRATRLDPATTLRGD